MQRIDSETNLINNTPIRYTSTRRIDTETGLVKRNLETIEEIFSYERFAEIQKRLEALE